MGCIGHKMIEQTCKLFPRIRDKIDYIHIASPVRYMGGVGHSKERFDPLTVARLRPETDIPGLYMTGQDILTCGFNGALYSGVLTAQVCLGRNVMYDVMSLHNTLNNTLHNTLNKPDNKKKSA